ncbi:MAG: HesA/MoeB/ThiF family protein [Akkermansia muciniphila]
MTLTQEETERYARHLSLPELGEQGQYKLKRAHVALTGLGGLGSPAALYLAAAGVGRLTLIDPDEVCLSNLQRQILHATDAAGMAKTASAARRLYALNPPLHHHGPQAPYAGKAVSLLEGCDWS